MTSFPVRPFSLGPCGGSYWALQGEGEGSNGHPPSPPVDPQGILTGPTGDFAGPTWGSDGLWHAKGELGRSCRHSRVTHWFLNPDLWVAGEGSNGIPPLPVDLLRVYTESSLTNNW